MPTNYHWPTDTPDRVDYGTVADAARLARAVARRIAAGDDRAVARPESAGAPAGPPAASLA